MFSLCFPSIGVKGFVLVNILLRSWCQQVHLPGDEAEKILDEKLSDSENNLILMTILV